MKVSRMSWGERIFFLKKKKKEKIGKDVWEGEILLSWTIFIIIIIIIIIKWLRFQEWVEVKEFFFFQKKEKIGKNVWEGKILLSWTVFIIIIIIIIIIKWWRLRRMSWGERIFFFKKVWEGEISLSWTIFIIIKWWRLREWVFSFSKKRKDWQRLLNTREIQYEARWKDFFLFQEKKRKDWQRFW